MLFLKVIADLPLQSGKRLKGRQYPTDVTSDDEDDLDYEGALAIFVQSTKRVFADPSSDAKSYHGEDAVDAPSLNEVDAGDQDRQVASYLRGHQFTRRHAADCHPKSYTDLI